MQASTSKKRFRPGELAPITGIYMVTHGARHRERHEVVVIRGEQLPTCRTCKLNLSYQIVRPISHITHDWDFSGPHNLVISPRHDDFRDFRMFRRVSMQLPITLELPSTSSPVMIHGYSSDLSAGGMGTVIRNRLPSRYKTDPVKIHVEPDGKALTLEAHFCYQTGVRYGFEFNSIGVGEREAIRRLIDTEKKRASNVAG